MKNNSTNENNSNNSILKENTCNSKINMAYTYNKDHEDKKKFDLVSKAEWSRFYSFINDTSNNFINLWKKTSPKEK